MGTLIDTPKTLMAAGLDSRESDELRAIGYLQRLNLAGYDVKGLLSSAYGQSGVGVELGSKIDFGAMFIPFVHLDLGLDVNLEGTAHSLLLLQRLPDRVWITDMERPPQPPKSAQTPPLPMPNPDWHSARPLAMALLRGIRLEVKAAALAAAWAGFGSPDYDETGLTIGVQAKGRFGKTRLTRLADTAPRHYPPRPSDGTLNDDIDDLFDANLKSKAAAWLIETGGGVQELMALGAPRISLVDRARQSVGWKDVEPAVLTALDAWDKLTIPDVDAVASTEVGISVVRTMVKAAKTITALVRSKKLTTAALLADFDAVNVQLRSWTEYLAHSDASRIFGGRSRRAMWEIAKRRRAEAEDLTKALRRRQDRKQRSSKPAEFSTPVDKSPPFHFDIMATEWSGDASLAGKFVLPKDSVTLKASINAELQKRTISFRFQSFVPGAFDRSLVSSQDTVITYATREISADAVASSREYLKKNCNLVTMSYRSVVANWFDDLAPDNHTAIPNGSGVCFGMSVLSESLAAYVRICKLIKRPPAGTAAPELDAGLQALEEAMTKQLRVEREELRGFMRNAPSGLDKVPLDSKGAEKAALAESWLVESGFAFTTPHPLPITDRRPDSLFKLGAVKALEKNGQRGSSLRLQIIRLRYRIRSDDDKSKNIIRLGWNPQPWGDEGFDKVPLIQGNDSKDPWYQRLTGIDPSLPDWMKWSSLALELGIGIERVRRAGSEGIAEIYQWVYPKPFPIGPGEYTQQRAKDLETKAHTDISDMVVPPVALFNY